MIADKQVRAGGVEMLETGNAKPRGGALDHPLQVHLDHHLQVIDGAHVAQLMAKISAQGGAQQPGEGGRQAAQAQAISTARGIFIACFLVIAVLKRIIGYFSRIDDINNLTGALSSVNPASARRPHRHTVSRDCLKGLFQGTLSQGNVSQGNVSQGNVSQGNVSKNRRRLVLESGYMCSNLAVMGTCFRSKAAARLALATGKDSDHDQQSTV